MQCTLCMKLRCVRKCFVHDVFTYVVCLFVCLFVFIQIKCANIATRTGFWLMLFIQTCNLLHWPQRKAVEHYQIGSLNVCHIHMVKINMIFAFDARESNTNGWKMKKNEIGRLGIKNTILDNQNSRHFIVQSDYSS